MKVSVDRSHMQLIMKFRLCPSPAESPPSGCLHRCGPVHGIKPCGGLELSEYVNSEAFLNRQNDLKRSLMQENFDVLSIREREMHLMLAGDGETVFLFMVLLPYMEVFELPKAYIWKLRRLATRFRARPFVTTLIPEVRHWFFVPLTALRDDGSSFVLDVESCRHRGFYLQRLISEELQQRLM